MTETVSNFLFNSARWDGLEIRDGDIVIATPAKCGTTWTQRIVSLLIFDSTDLYAPMSHISPWLDMNTRPVDDVLRELDAQTHRRFVKSHLRLHAPAQGRSNHLHHGRSRPARRRDLVDAPSRQREHRELLHRASRARLAWTTLSTCLRTTCRTQPEPRRSASGTGSRNPKPGEGLGGLIDHIGSFWNHRDEPNVVLLHYADMQRDLVGQMAYLADRLGIDRSRERTRGAGARRVVRRDEGIG